MSEHRDLDELNPHLGLWASETYASAAERAWDRFYAKCERLLGHDLDGDDKQNGYSIDGAYAAFEAGETAEAYVAEVNAGDGYVPLGPIFRVRELPADAVAAYVAAGAVRAPFQVEQLIGCLGWFPLSVHETQAQANAAMCAILKGTQP